MADAETEAEWERSKQIEKERMKAAKALAEEKPDSVNLAFLDPETTKSKGFSRGREAILMSIEKLGNFSVAGILGGIFIRLVMWAIRGFMLNSAGQIIHGVFDGIGLITMSAGFLVGIFILFAALWFYFKYGYKPKTFVWTVVWTLVIGVLYIIISNNFMV